jgi:hypothetical protein
MCFGVLSQNVPLRRTKVSKNSSINGKRKGSVPRIIYRMSFSNSMQFIGSIDAREPSGSCSLNAFHRTHNVLSRNFMECDHGRALNS